VQTDMFSLGVTLYEVLTGEHPYFDFEKGGFSSTLRKDPLSRVLSERGREIHAVVSLISSALEINPAQRPQSYGELLRGSGLRTSKQQGQSQGPEDIVAQVALYRNQGRFDIAMRLLDGALESAPTDALLLNARGCLLIVLKDSDRAIEALSSAMSVLETHSGRYEGQAYPDPAVNLSRQLLLKQDFSGADKVLARSWEWIRRDDSFFSSHYTEFGWWLLYRGQFRQCCEHLQKTFRFKAPDLESLRWMTLAAVLGNELSVLATEIGRYYMRLPIDVGSALCIALVADAVPSDIAGALLQRANEEVGAALSQVREELGLPNSELQSPLSARAKSVIVRSLDYSVTGGKYNGILR
jgi:tetratricopeptide (TPR) repeat protein